MSSFNESLALGCLKAAALEFVKYLLSLQFITVIISIAKISYHFNVFKYNNIEFINTF